MAEQTSKTREPSQPGKPSQPKQSSQPKQPSLSADEIEAEIIAKRAHLASTIDELALRAQPREIARRQTESAKARFVDATHTPQGDLRMERIGAIAAAASAVFVVLAILHRRYHRG
jgi:hypothetical protein